jgi:hypothetical protein
MPIDACPHTFTELAKTILPKYMKKIRIDIKNSRPLTEFCTPGVGVKTIATGLGKPGDFSGCYVFLHNGLPFYVGISRRVLARLRQHGTGRTHFDASLAYRMACQKAPHKLTRTAAMKNPIFWQAFDEAKRLLMNSRIAIVEIQNPLELYVFEAYCAMKLDTCEWNTFRTH